MLIVSDCWATDVVVQPTTSPQHADLTGFDGRRRRRLRAAAAAAASDGGCSDARYGWLRLGTPCPGRAHRCRNTRSRSSPHRGGRTTTGSRRQEAIASHRHAVGIRKRHRWQWERPVKLMPMIAVMCCCYPQPDS